MEKRYNLIIGGTGQFGITLGNLLKKNKKKVIITSRTNSRISKIKNIKITKLNIYNKKEIFSCLKKFKPARIFYFAGQSSPNLSFKKKNETMRSNYLGCKNVLDVIYSFDKSIKFLHAASSEMYGKVSGKISLKTPKHPVNPYGQAKLKAFNITKLYREKFNLKTYNAVIFNTESLLRRREFLIPKICLAAIKAKKKKIKTEFGNLNISREWNWCEDQCELLIKFLNKAPQDFILSNGKPYSAKQMLKFAFGYFNLNYKKYVYENNTKFLRPRDILNKKSSFNESLKKNNIKKKKFVYGKKLIFLIIKYYLKKEYYKNKNYYSL